MLDDLKEEEIVNKVGGRFKLSTLIQKRMVALNTGARPLVDSRSNDRLAIVLQEILQDKIYLDATGTSAKFASPEDLAADSSGNLWIADYGNNHVRKIVVAANRRRR